MSFSSPTNNARAGLPQNKITAKLWVGDTTAMGILPLNTQTIGQSNSYASIALGDEKLSMNTGLTK